MTVPGSPPLQPTNLAAWMRAIVTQASPLRVILLDRDTTELDATPDTLVADLAVDDQVWVAMLNGSLTVVGRDGGTPATVAATASMVVVRDAAGRAQVADPSADADIATKGYADDLIVTIPKGVIPSSVVVGSGSASVADDGTVTFTGVSYVALNGVFDGLGGDTYLVTYHAVGTSCTVYCRLRASGTDSAGTSYAYTAMYSQLAAGPSRASSEGAAQFGYGCPTTGGTTRNVQGHMLLSSPGKAETTVYDSVGSSDPASDRYRWGESGTGPATAHDGLTLLFSANTGAGTIKVVKLS